MPDLRHLEKKTFDIDNEDLTPEQIDVIVKTHLHSRGNPRPKILFRKLPVTKYIDRMINKQYFALVGYGVDEWYCMIPELEKDGTTQPSGETISTEHGEELIDVYKEYQSERDFIFSMPETDVPDIGEKTLERFKELHRVKMSFNERDMITTDLSYRARLNPLIRHLQTMEVILIAPKPLKKLRFLNYKHFVPVTRPNLHLENNGIENAVNKALEYEPQTNAPVYLISAGISSPVIIEQLHITNQEAFYIDCGDIWDPFAGIPSHRNWVNDLYRNQTKLDEWKEANIKGTNYAS